MCADEEEKIRNEVDSTQRPPGRREALAGDRSHSTCVLGPAVFMLRQNPPATSMMMSLCEAFRPTVVTKSGSSLEQKAVRVQKIVICKREKEQMQRILELGAPGIYDPLHRMTSRPIFSRLQHMV